MSTSQPALYLDVEPGAKIDCASGIEPARARGYERGAHTAVQDWRSIDRDELAQLGTHFDRHASHDTISLITVPSSLVELMREVARVAPRDPTYLREVCSFVEAWLREQGWEALTADGGHGLKFSPADPRSLTRDPHTSELVGLHLDSWDRAPMSDRQTCQNRVCVNLGDGVRAFQFVPLDARAVAQASASTQKPTHDVVTTFLRENPTQPVLRCRLLPGQAYVAPTENIIHDACSLGDEPDLTFTMRGRFSRRSPRSSQC